MPSRGLIMSHTQILRRRSGNRAGFTLTELMIVVVLVGIIGTMLTTLLVRQQSFHRSVASIADARARMRDIATILPTDMRSISTVDGDIVDLSNTALQFRAFVGASVMCGVVAGSPTIIEIPPKNLSSGNVLTAWINPPVAGDLAFIYDDGAAAGNADDAWQPYVIQTVQSAADATWCPSTATPAYTTAADNAAVRYRITFTTPLAASIKAGAPIRFAREVRYSGYQGSDGQWYVGYQTCAYSGTIANAGVCGDREVLAGPIQPVTASASTSGLWFQYFNQTGAEVTTTANARTVARADIVVRTTSMSLRRATRINAINTEIAGGDSLRFHIGFRNRI